MRPLYHCAFSKSAGTTARTKFRKVSVLANVGNSKLL